MPTVQTASEVLDRHFLELRCELLNLAAGLDRIFRSDGAAAAEDDSRLDQITQGLQILLTSGTDRAERIQLLFSDSYIDGWNRKR